jgi:hypothetical protein
MTHPIVAVHLPRTSPQAVSIPDELESLALELRDENGNVVATDWISFRDGHRPVALAREEMAAIDPDLTFEDDLEPWQPAPPRCQVLVALEGSRSGWIAGPVGGNNRDNREWYEPFRYSLRQTETVRRLA